ncbi:MAG: hypothetical protein JWP55_3784 [Mycobacterium sp.]|jgi:hypothetical protein|nr:hypothetical protein [Mycobacterium sp.]
MTTSIAQSQSGSNHEPSSTATHVGRVDEEQHREDHFGDALGDVSIECVRQPTDPGSWDRQATGYGSSAAAATTTGSTPSGSAATCSTSLRFMRGSQNLLT